MPRVKTPLAHNLKGATSYGVSDEALSCCLAYWSKAGTYTGRKQEDVDKDMNAIFSDNEQVALAIVFGLRLITRKPKLPGMEDVGVQTGYGRRDEFYKACVWLQKNRPHLLYKNLHLIPIFGSWRDFFVEPLIDMLDRNQVLQVLRANLDDELLRKYLPQIRSKGKQRSPRDIKRINIAKQLAKFVNFTYAQYRKHKAQGKAHIWQKQMSQGEWDKINFNGIPGRAMLHHTQRRNRKDQKTVFERHGQVERLLDWLVAQKQVKFVGYPYELALAAQGAKSILQTLMLDKQAETLIEPMKNHKLGNVLAAIDTSGSMGCTIMSGVRPLDICVSMGAIFSMLNVGGFKDVVAGFDSASRLVTLGGGFCARVNQLYASCYMGGTNFQSLIDLIVDVRKRCPQIPIEEFPSTLLVISDMQFNPAAENRRYRRPEEDKISEADTNYKVAMKKLEAVGLGKMRIIWWYVNGMSTDFPVAFDEPGTYLVGGFDPSNLKALMGLVDSAPAEAPAKKDDEAAPEPLSSKDFDAKAKEQETPMDGMKNFLAQPIFSLLLF